VLNPASTGGLTFNLTNLVNPNLGDRELPDFELKFTSNPNNNTGGNNLQFNSLNNLTNATGNPVNGGERVGPQNTFNEQFNLLTINPDGTQEGAFNSATNTFLGLQVDVPGGSPHFGWLEINIAPDATLTVLALAIEDQPDVPIVAGRISSVPEPDSLALLALGATGLAAWRRRRGQQAELRG
jgi:hypothetical protein